MSKELHGVVALKSILVDAVMRSGLFSEHDIGNSRRVVGPESNGLHSITINTLDHTH